MTPGSAAEQLVTIRLIGLPLRLHARAQEQGEAMRREFQLVLEQAQEDPGSVPARLLELSTMLSSQYERFTEEQEQQIEDALLAGQDRLDELVFRVPPHAGNAAAQLGAVLEEADRFCRTEQLLTLAAPPDLVAYRRWYLDNFVVQCAGGAPLPWPGEA